MGRAWAMVTSVSARDVPCKSEVLFHGPGLGHGFLCVSVGCPVKVHVDLDESLWQKDLQHVVKILKHTL